NDLQFAYASGKQRLVAVDTTPVGLARRLGMARPASKLAKIGGRVSRGLIPWDQVDPTAIGPAGVPLKVASTDLAKMHPADPADLLSRMDQEEAEDVRELLAYPEDSAGGVMTTEFISIPAGLTAEQTIEHLRELHGNAPGTHYLYVTDGSEKLLGVISLWDLV